MANQSEAGDLDCPDDGAGVVEVNAALARYKASSKAWTACNKRGILVDVVR